MRAITRSLNSIISRFASNNKAKATVSFALAIAIGTLSQSGFTEAKQSSPSSRNKSVSAIKLTQRHFYFGEVRLILSKSGLRLEGDKKQKWVAVAKPPEWNISVYRLDDKTFFEQDMKTFMGCGLVSGMFMKYRQRFPLKDVKPIVIDVHGFKSYRQENAKDCFEFTVLDTAYPKELEQIMYALYKLPTGGGIPLMYVTLSEGKDVLNLKGVPNFHRNFLTTDTITTTTINPQIFERPDGLRRAKYVGEVMVSQSARKQGTELDSLIDSPLNKN